MPEEKPRDVRLSRIVPFFASMWIVVCLILLFVEQYVVGLVFPHKCY